jgi:hypothetical protein
MKSVYCTVQNGSLNKAVCHSSLKGQCTVQQYSRPCAFKRHVMKPYRGGGCTGPHIHLGTRQTRVVALTAPTTSPQVPHKHEAGGTSDAAWMLWRPEKFLT